MNNIRNFSIIAHIDHGKSTLADRMLELTGTVEKRKMREQVLDEMELERERGITIKLAPARMLYRPSQIPSSKSEILHKSQITNAQKQNGLEFRNSDLEFADSAYVLNLIDTPGHIDFSYEVSRALKAVEGALLLVDATQGVQAQTLTTLDAARELGLVIIPVLSKVDAQHARIEEVKGEVVALLGCTREEVLETSGKTGQGVAELLDAIVARVPPPRETETFHLRDSAPAPYRTKGSGSGSDPRSSANALRALVFDFSYSSHRGVVVYIRVFDGAVAKSDQLFFSAAGERFGAQEVGVFAPDAREVERLVAGEIGYVVTGIKEAGIASVGDTLTQVSRPLSPLSGYLTPKPVVWASLFPESQSDFTPLRQALSRLRLSDSSLSYEEESSSVLGRGFRCGFLGMLHLEIVAERLRREFNLDIIVTTPSVTYEVQYQDGAREVIYTPSKFPDNPPAGKGGGAVASVKEPWVRLQIITPGEYLGPIMEALYEHEGIMGETHSFGDASRGGAHARMRMEVEMPLRELMRNLFGRIKSVSSGFASLSYELHDMRPADVVRLDVLVAEEPVPAFSRIVPRHRLDTEARQVVERLHALLPRQLFVTKIQARATGRIIASRTLPALRKDVTGYLYGGDVTRKRKLLEKQKKGKKKMQARGKVTIPHDVFLKMMRAEER